MFQVNSPQIWTDSVSNLDPALDLELEKLATEDLDLASNLDLSLNNLESCLSTSLPPSPWTPT